MYDILTVSCPRCKNVVEFLSQGGDCNFLNYDLEDCPGPVLEDVINDQEPCRQCGAVIGIEIRGGTAAKVTNNIGVV